MHTMHKQQELLGHTAGSKCTLICTLLHVHASSCARKLSIALLPALQALRQWLLEPTELRVGALDHRCRDAARWGGLGPRTQSVGSDPGDIGGYRRGGQGFELLGHAEMLLLCQKSEAALTCEKHWGASCLPVSQAQMYFFPCQEFCFWTSCAYLFHKTLFSSVSLMFWIYF